MAPGLTTRSVDGGVVVVDAGGELMFGESARAFRDAVRGHLAGGDRKFIIDVHAIETIDSAGLGELVAAYSSIRDREGDIKLIRLPGHLRDMLDITRLLTVFDCFDDEGSAVAALNR